MIIPREYQETAAKVATTFFHGPARNPVMEVIPSGGGKSVVIANTVKDLDGSTIVLQPSKEILEQNYMKYINYGYSAGIYSARQRKIV